MTNEPMQMALPVTLPDDETFSSYFGGENSQVVMHLQSILERFNKVTNLSLPIYVA